VARFRRDTLFFSSNFFLCQGRETIGVPSFSFRSEISLSPKSAMDYDDEDEFPRPSFAGQKRKVEEMSSSDEEEAAAARPSFGFQSFQRAATRSESPPTMTGLGGGGGARRSPWNNNNNMMSANSASATPNQRSRGGGAGKKQGSTPAGGNSFAARMMAKMGYVEGQGLGSAGHGIVNPVEAQTRPQGLGLGAVKEKSKQARDEEKRQAAAKGEVVEDSSDEERQRRQKRKAQQRKQEGRSGASTPAGPRKPRFRTAREMEVEAEGLEVPSVLMSLVDATGKEQKVLTSTAGLMTPMEFVNQEEGEALKIARRARHDLEAFVDEWKGLTERKKFIEFEETQVVHEIDTQQVKADQLTNLVSAISELQVSQDQDDITTLFEGVTCKLELIEVEYRDLIDEYRLSDAAVAAIHPLFRKAVEEWEPLKDPTYLVAQLRRLLPLLSRPRSENAKERQRQSTTSYEALIYSIWLPRVRSALLNEWDVYEPSPATSLIVAWKDVIPSFVYANVLDQVVVPKLSAAIKEWRPRASRHHKTSSQPGSHFPWWLFTWLQYLDERHTDPRHATGLLSDVKRKFRVVLDKWDLRKGLVDGVELWKEALGSEFDVTLQNHLLPRLARHLRDDFEVNPQDQDLTAFEDVLKWKDYYKPKVFGLLLVAEFFPKWHSILYVWLTNEPNFEEVGEWFTWWRSQVPSDLNEIVAVDDEWTKALKMMDLASQLGDRAATELPPPEITPSAAPAASANLRPDKAIVPPAAAAAKAKPQPAKEVAFKDIVEDWCAEQGLIILPLREAHPQNGHPLFRITASASGKGGTVVFLQGDVVWAQNRKARDTWEPMGLEGRLVDRAEGK
jgi:tuftelin-interacting protein 11